MKSKDGKYGSLYCSCGCGNGALLKAERDEDIGYRCMMLVSDNFYVSQMARWIRLKEKLKRILAILRNEEYCYFDICIDDNDLKEFKEFVAKMQ